eukprot:m.310657 g.310657  ORF g.310657 m.310657 type:complete len:251 (+) comp53491_c0_seq1:24-776(+)
MAHAPSEAGSDAGVADMSDDSDVSAASSASKASAASRAAKNKARKHRNLCKPDSDMWSSMAVVDWDDGESEATECSVEYLETDVGESLIKAAQSGETAVVEAALKGCEPEVLNFKDPDGYSPLHRATYNGHVEVMKKLLAAGADIGCETNDGWQPLHCACRWNQTEAASLLVQSGALVNAKTHGGQTPLHLACSMRNGGSTITLLLGLRNLKAHEKNAAGETPIELARRTGVHAYLFEMVENAVCDSLRY